jgi:redox-regulated HSP33 family molecular chaperone
MEKVEKALALIGLKELQDMLAKEGHAMIQCEFCATKYHADQTMLKQLIAGAQPKG